MNKIFTIVLLTLLCHSPVAKTYHFVGANFPGILTQNESGKFHGSAVEIIEKASKKLRFDYKISIVPWIRAIRMVENKKADVLIGPYKTSKREETMVFTENYFYEDSIILVTLAQSKFKWSGDLSSIKEKKVGVVRGWALGKKFEKESDNLDITYSESTTNLVRMLKRGRLDLAIVHNRSFLDDLNSHSVKREDYKILTPPLSSQKGYFAFSKEEKLKSFIQKFNSEIPLPKD